MRRLRRLPRVNARHCGDVHHVLHAHDGTGRRWRVVLEIVIHGGRGAMAQCDTCLTLSGCTTLNCEKPGICPIAQQVLEFAA